ncbi:hypothetical protein COCON_G00042330 [Conger conger]|uniref:Uncharacterized protein n=1 Tax=Conger conger TaxID=82655 RepID=A0A9Q1I3Z2_CONCO|nr:hypothetical protein COCON_G00042330 [Conger conger]
MHNKQLQAEWEACVLWCENGQVMGWWVGGGGVIINRKMLSIIEVPQQYFLCQFTKILDAMISHCRSCKLINLVCFSLLENHSNGFSLGRLIHLVERVGLFMM